MLSEDLVHLAMTWPIEVQREDVEMSCEEDEELLKAEMLRAPLNQESREKEIVLEARGNQESPLCYIDGHMPISQLRS